MGMTDDWSGQQDDSYGEQYGQTYDQQYQPDDSQPTGGSYYATCEVSHGGPIVGAWIGPTRSTYDAAQADADDHNAKNSGHEAYVVS